MAGDGVVPPSIPGVPGTEAAGEAVAAKAEAVAVEKPKTDPWKIEAQPIREDQVVNAVNFLSHPKVRSSPIVHRRTFLERKGLTPEEIDEAFRRCPDPPTSEVASTPVPSTSVQAAAPSPQPVAPPAQALVAAQKPHEYTWGQKLLGLGAIVTAGAGAGVLTKAYLLPMFKSWIRSILTEEDETDKKISPPTPGVSVEPPVNESALAANAAAAAASEVAAAMREFSHSRAKESLQLGSIIKALETQTHELKTALSGMRDVVNNNNSSNNSVSSEFTTPTAIGRGYRQDPWRTPEMPRPSGMLADRTYAGAVLAPTPAEKVETPENGSEPVTGS
jgi:peroxin-14